MHSDSLPRGLCVIVPKPDRKLPPRPVNKTITGHFVVSEMGRYFGISYAEMRSSRRTHRLVMPRQMAMVLVRRMLETSYPKTGRIFGKRDSTCVFHAIRKLATMQGLYPYLDYLERHVRHRHAALLNEQKAAL